MLKLPKKYSLPVIFFSVTTLFGNQILAADRWASTTVSNELAGEFWLPREALSVEIAAELPPYCSGAYQPPVFPYPLSIDNDTYPIETSAEGSLEYTLSKEAILLGEVRISQGNRSLETENSEYNLMLWLFC